MKAGKALAKEKAAARFPVMMIMARKDLMAPGDRQKKGSQKRNGLSIGMIRKKREHRVKEEHGKHFREIAIEDRPVMQESGNVIRETMIKDHREKEERRKLFQETAIEDLREIAANAEAIRAITRGDHRVEKSAKAFREAATGEEMIAIAKEKSVHSVEMRIEAKDDHTVKKDQGEDLFRKRSARMVMTKKKRDRSRVMMIKRAAAMEQARKAGASAMMQMMSKMIMNMALTLKRKGATKQAIDLPGERAIKKLHARRTMMMSREAFD